ncbi:MAG: glycosyltransferase [Proteobacteria bacterium]|nr:glycosyltransferase [Pseudomonadota bacterium]MBU1738354.1 glycosyltransferase [Pseudomonadota bacterium]
MSLLKYESLDIIIPVYNEATTIAATLDEIGEKLHIPYRIHVIYDREDDTTLPVVKECRRENANIRLVRNCHGKGALNAIKTGLECVSGGVGLVMMADLADDPVAVDGMFAKINEGYDIVCGSRYMKGGRQIGGPLLKKTLSRLAGVSLHYLTGLPTRDATNSFKMYTSKVLAGLTIESRGGFELGIELVVKAYAAGYAIAEVPSVWRDRLAGESRFRLWRWLPGYLRWYWYGIRATIAGRGRVGN